MGWTSSNSWKKKSEVVSECVAMVQRNGYKIIAKAKTIEALYLGIERPDGTKEILVFLIQKIGDSFGYKDLTEAMGPAATDCPLNLLAIIPDPCRSYSTEWRQCVVNHHHAKNRDLMGCTIRLSLNDHKTYKVDGRQGLSYLVTRMDGKRFRLTKAQAIRAIVVPEVLA